MGISRFKIILLIFAYSLIYSSSALALDEWKLQQQQFEIQMKLQEQQMRQQQQAFKQQMQFMEQQLKFSNEQFKVYQQPLGQQMLWQQNVTPIVIDSSTMIFPQSSFAWTNLEAVGLSHPTDSIRFFKASIDLFRNSITKQLGPDSIIIRNGQMVWAAKPNALSNFLMGGSVGLSVGIASWKDMELIETGNWTMLRSSLFKEGIKQGMSFIGRNAEVYANSAGKQMTPTLVHVAAQLQYILPIVDGVFSQLDRKAFRPNINEIDSYSRAAGTWALNYLVPGVGIAFEPISQSISYISQPHLVRWMIMQDYKRQQKLDSAAGLPSRTIAQVYGAEHLRNLGFEPNITGLPSIQRMPKKFNIQQTRLESFNTTHSQSIYQTKDLLNTTIEKNVFGRESRVIDPLSSTTTTIRQWSRTTRETTMPNTSFTSNWNNPISSFPKSSFNSYTPPFNSYTPPFNSYTPPFNSYTPPFNSYTPPFNSYTPPFNSYTPPFNSYTPPFNSYKPNFDTYKPNLTNPYIK